MSYRVLPLDNLDALSTLRIGHRSTAFDSAGIEADYRLALPVDVFTQLEASGTIGALHHEAYSFMGSITSPTRLVRQTAPRLAQSLASAGVDGVFLCPV